MAATRKLVVQVVGDARGLKKAFESAARESMTFGEKVASSSKKMAIPAAAAFGALTAAGISFAKAAAEDQQAAALLARQLQTTTGATSAQIAATEDFISKLSMASGVADDVLRPSLAQLVRSTGDLSKAQDLLKLSLDVSAGTGKSFSSVVTAISKASMGQFTALKRLGFPIDDNIIKTKNFSAAMQVLSQVFNGQAAVAANSTKGQFDRFSVAIQEAKESIGAALLPAISAVLPKLIGLGQWAQNNGPLIVAVGTAVAGFAAAILVTTTALKVWSAAAKITALVNAGLASSYFAVQVATGIGIATAIAGAAAIAGIALQMRGAVSAAGDFSDAMMDTGTSVTYGFTPAITSATQATTALYGVMGATEESVLSLGDSLRGGLYGPMGGVAKFVEPIKSLAPAFNTSSGAASRAANKMQQFRDSVKAVKEQVRGFVRSVADQVSRTVSLSDAFNTAQDEQKSVIDNLTQALQDRKAAYEALNQARITGDTLGYAKALQDVADAEAAVGSAQAAKPRSYTDIFREQIAAAKNFATNLKALAKTGNLSQAALQQLLDLGPVAGAQVAADLLSGVDGFTASSLSADLASVASAGRSVGLSMPGVSELLGAKTGGTANNYYITVQAGVGDKNAIANEIVDLLKVYNRSNGAIPVKVR